MAEGNTIEIAPMLYPGAQMSAVLGMTDLFNLTNRIVMAVKAGIR